jgi:hypothetical protein
MSQDEHRADGHLEGVVAQVQRVPDRQRDRDRDPEAPPREPDQRRQARGEQDPGDHRRDPADRAAQRLVEADLGDEQRGQRHQHGM